MDNASNLMEDILSKQTKNYVEYTYRNPLIRPIYTQMLLLLLFFWVNSRGQFLLDPLKIQMPDKKKKMKISD